jgi:hypothetical protein
LDQVGAAAVESIATAEDPCLFFFFSNRLGCLGSIAISIGITLLLLFLLGWI